MLLPWLATTAAGRCLDQRPQPGEQQRSPQRRPEQHDPLHAFAAQARQLRFRRVAVAAEQMVDQLPGIAFVQRRAHRGDDVMIDRHAAPRSCVDIERDLFQLLFRHRAVGSGGVSDALRHVRLHRQPLGAR
jgi:hypothetical protein